jgi:hypothetical protein
MIVNLRGSYCIFLVNKNTISDIRGLLFFEGLSRGSIASAVLLLVTVCDVFNT